MMQMGTHQEALNSLAELLLRRDSGENSTAKIFTMLQMSLDSKSLQRWGAGNDLFKEQGM